MFLFGVVSICQGLVSSYGGLLTTRFFLGVFETGMFPGCFYIIGMWYRRHEAQRRYSFFFCSTTLAGAFGGLLASAMGLMDGLHGYRGWRWIFILEGILTCILALCFVFILPVFPEDAKWLTAEGKVFVQARLALDQGESSITRKITLKDSVKVLLDPKVIAGGFIYFGFIVTGYGYAHFSPEIIYGFGYSAIQTQLHSVAVWAAAFAFSMMIAFISDKVMHRFCFVCIGITVCISGLAMLLSVDDLHVQYAALFLVVMGVFTAMPVSVCWFNMNLGGHHRRSIGSAWQVGFGNLGPIIAVFAFLEEDAPKYIRGYSIAIAFSCLGLMAATIYFLLCWTANRKRDTMSTDANMSVHDEAELGDLCPGYRYLL